VAAPDHGKGINDIEVCGTRKLRDRLTTRVDQILIDVRAFGDGSRLQHPDLRMKNHIPAFEPVADEGGNADAEINIGVILYFSANPQGDNFPGKPLKFCHCSPSSIV